MVSLLGRNDRSIRRQHEMNTRVGDQVRLELGNVNVECSIKTKRGSQGRDDLGDQSVQVGVGRTFNVKVAATDVVQRLVLRVTNK